MNNRWTTNDEKISRALENGARTIHEIFMETDLSYPTIRSHPKSVGRVLRRAPKSISSSDTPREPGVSRLEPNQTKKA